MNDDNSKRVERKFLCSEWSTNHMVTVVSNIWEASNNFKRSKWRQCFWNKLWILQSNKKSVTFIASRQFLQLVWSAAHARQQFRNRTNQLCVPLASSEQTSGWTDSVGYLARNLAALSTVSGRRHDSGWHVIVWRGGVGSGCKNCSNILYWEENISMRIWGLAWQKIVIHRPFSPSSFSIQVCSANRICSEVCDDF